MKLIDNIKGFFSNEEEDFDTEEDFDDEEEIDEESGETKIVKKPSKKAEYEKELKSKEAGVILFEPKTYAESKDIVACLKSNRAIIINSQKLTPDAAKRVLDFTTGATYALDGEIKRVGANIFLCAPKNFGVAGKINIDDLSASVDETSVKKW